MGVVLIGLLWTETAEIQCQITKIPYEQTMVAIVPEPNVGFVCFVLSQKTVEDLRVGELDLCQSCRCRHLRLALAWALVSIVVQPWGSKPIVSRSTQKILVNLRILSFHSSHCYLPMIPRAPKRPAAPFAPLKNWQHHNSYLVPCWCDLGSNAFAVMGIPTGDEWQNQLAWAKSNVLL